MRKEDKGLIIEQIASTVKDYAHFYVTDTSTMNAKQTTALRRECYANGIKLLVVKNALLRKALESLEVDYSPLYESLKGASALMFTNSASAPAKLIKELTKKTDKPALKAAYAEESFYVGAHNLDALVAIKSRNELIAEVIALLQSPAKNVISGLQGAAGNKIHGILTTLSER